MIKPMPEGWERFLEEDEGPIFERINPEGETPLVLICDHADNKIPRAMKNLGLEHDLLQQHIAWDIGAAEVTRLVAKRLDCQAFLTRFSRLIIDVNRAPGDPASIPEESDGSPIPGNRNLSEEEQVARAEVFAHPYHQAISDGMAHVMRNSGPPALFSIHSFTPIMMGRARPWDAGILWNRDPRIALPMIEHLRQHSHLHIGDNEPYDGKQLAYSIDRHGMAAGLPNAAIEIRQDLIANQEGVETWAKLLGDALEDTLSREGLYHVEHF